MIIKNQTFFLRHLQSIHQVRGPSTTSDLDINFLRKNISEKLSLGKTVSDMTRSECYNHIFSEQIHGDCDLAFAISISLGP